MKFRILSVDPAFPEFGKMTDFIDAEDEDEAQAFFQNKRPDLQIISISSKIEKYSVFRSPDDRQVYAIRNVPPRFTARYATGERTSNIEFMDFQNEPLPDPVKVVKLMRGVGEAIARFLQTEENERRSKE